MHLKMQLRSVILTRRELAIKVFELLEPKLIISEAKLWRAIAETDDNSLLNEFTQITKQENLNK